MTFQVWRKAYCPIKEVNAASEALCSTRMMFAAPSDFTRKLRSTRWKQDAFGQVNMVGSGSVNIAVLIPTNISCPSYWYWLPASMVYQLSTQPPHISIIQDNHGSETSKKQGYSGAFYSFLDVFGANLHGNLLRTHRSLLPGSDWVCAAADQLGWTPIRREKCDENPVENPVENLQRYCPCTTEHSSQRSSNETEATNRTAGRNLRHPETAQIETPTRLWTLGCDLRAAKTQVRKTNISRHSEYRTMTHVALPVRLSNTPWKNEWLQFLKIKMQNRLHKTTNHSSDAKTGACELDTS